MSTLSDHVLAGCGKAQIRFWPDADELLLGSDLGDGTRSMIRSGGPSTVGAILQNDVPSVDLVVSAVLGGARLASLPIPARGVALPVYGAQLSRLCERVGIEQVVAPSWAVGALQDLGLNVRSFDGIRSGPPVASPAPNGFELVQCTSGTTDQPKAIALSDAAIGANVTAILRALEPVHGDSALTWLPLSHDMGLIGLLLTSIAASAPDWADGTSTTIMDPRHFLGRPSTWMDAIAATGATFTGAPDFGFRMASRYPDNSHRQDLSGLRVAIVGGEIVRADTLQNFATSHQGSGFSPVAFCPSYGMAEFGLAVSMTRPGDSWKQSSVHRSENSAITPAVVSSGRPLSGYTVIEDQRHGSPPYPLLATGPSLGRNAITHALDAGEGYRTGDLGQVIDAEVYVQGRSDDWIVVVGRNLFAPTIEASLSRVAGVRSGRVATTVAPDGKWWVFYETDQQSVVSALHESVSAATLSVCGIRPDRVQALENGTLPFTSSGKLRRRALQQMSNEA